MKKELWQLIYMSADRVHLHAARLIGYAGCTPFAFWDASKLLPNYDQRKFDEAMRDLTRGNLRESSDPRYEFNAEACKAVRVLLGPTPEDPEYAAYWSKQIHQPGMKEPYFPKAKEEKPSEQKKPARKAAPKKAKKG